MERKDKSIDEQDINDFLLRCSSRMLEIANDNPKEIGLLNGLSGSILSLAYLSKTKSIIQVDSTFPLIQHVVNCLNTPSSGTICGGTAGVSWMLRLIAKEGIIEAEDIDDVLGDIDKINIAVFKSELEKGNIDYLHGAIGIAHYLLTFGIETEFVCTRVVEKLKELAEEDNWGRICWRRATYVQTYKLETVYNLGLAHGMGAIIYILSEIIELTQNENAAALLNGVLQYYKYLFDNNTSLPYSFPMWMPIQSEYPQEIAPRGKKAWCYGDIGVSFALLKAAQVLNNNSVYKMTISVLKKAILENHPVYDWCFCHGLSGLYYMYKKLNTIPELKGFESISELWLSRLINKREQILKDGSLGILQGIPGVVLALLNAEKKDLGTWDSFLLLDAI